MASTTQRPPVRHRPSTAPISAPTRIPPAGLTIGRTGENQIVVDDVLASRRHARLVRIGEGLGIEDLGSVNGTFVNGARTRRTVLCEGDIVTIGKVDLVVAGGSVRHRQRAPAETGLSLHGVEFVVEGTKQLLVDVSMGAGPGSLTAMIGPSGAGKSTLARVIAGSASPSRGAVTFEGRNLHAEYPGAAHPNRAGPAGGRAAPPAHRSPGAALRGRVAVTAGYDGRRPRPGDRGGYSRSSRSPSTPTPGSTGSPAANVSVRRWRWSC